MRVRLRCLNKSAVIAVSGKILVTTKKSTSLSLKFEGDVDSFFLIRRVLFIMSLFHVVRQSIKILLEGHEAFEGSSAKEED